MFLKNWNKGLWSLGAFGALGPLEVGGGSINEDFYFYDIIIKCPNWDMGRGGGREGVRQWV